jgi:hypothetical protein
MSLRASSSRKWLQRVVASLTEQEKRIVARPAIPMQ